MGATWNCRGGGRPRALSTLVVLGGALGLATAFSSSAGAADRQSLGTTTTSSTSGAVLIALGAGVLVLAGIGFVTFKWTRRKRQPLQCAEQRDALELAEKAVQYWEAARAHLESVERQRAASTGDGPDDSAHASLLANAVEGLRSAMHQRDERQLQLIRCMASGAPGTPSMPPAQSQPFFTPLTDGTPGAPARPES